MLITSFSAEKKTQYNWHAHSAIVCKKQYMEGRMSPGDSGIWELVKKLSKIYWKDKKNQNIKVNGQNI